MLVYIYSTEKFSKNLIILGHGDTDPLTDFCI